MARVDGRKANELRPVKIKRGFTKAPAGSVLIETGERLVSGVAKRGGLRFSVRIMVAGSDTPRSAFSTLSMRPSQRP